MKQEPTTKIPAYRGSGRPQEYKRILPPVRNLREIDTALLCELINHFLPGRGAHTNIKDRFTVNGYEVRLDPDKGLATVPGKIKFLYNDIRDLLDTLQREDVLDCSGQMIFVIGARYHKKTSKH